MFGMGIALGVALVPHPSAKVLVSAYAAGISGRARYLRDRPRVWMTRPKSLCGRCGPPSLPPYGFSPLVPPLPPSPCHFLPLPPSPAHLLPVVSCSLPPSLAASCSPCMFSVQGVGEAEGGGGANWTRDGTARGAKTLQIRRG